MPTYDKSALRENNQKIHLKAAFFKFSLVQQALCKVTYIRAVFDLREDSFKVSFCPFGLKLFLQILSVINVLFVIFCSE